MPVWAEVVRWKFLFLQIILVIVPCVDALSVSDKNAGMQATYPVFNTTLLKSHISSRYNRFLPPWETDVKHQKKKKKTHQRQKGRSNA